ncbi:MAG: DNA mismatch repair protein [Rhizobiales bacterium]|nr:DNA mismatch repair protein [Hyphomicrobiales bacterium]
MLTNCRSLAVACAAFALAASGPALADKPDEAEAYKTHLEFSGYEVTETDDRLSVKHPVKYNFGLYKLRGGLLAQGYITGADKMKSDRLTCLEVVNKVNARITSVRAYIDKDGDLALEAWYQPPYDRTRFAAFMDMFDEVRPILIEEDRDIDCLK